MVLDTVGMAGVYSYPIRQPYMMNGVIHVVILLGSR